MSTIRPLALLFLIAAAATAAEKPRAWQSADGRTLEGTLVEATETEVKIKRSADFQIVKVPLERLASSDRKLVMAVVREQWRDAGLKDGPHAAKITGQWEKAASKHGLNFQIYGSPKWDGKKRWPLLIWLHGSGQSGDDNTSQMGGATGVFTKEENQKARPCFMIAPQCPSADIGWNKQVADHLMALIADLCDRLPVDEGRIYLTGSSMGGFGCFNLAAKYPQAFAAVVPLCGGGDPGKADALKHTPIWAFHGDQDDQVPVDRTRNVVKAIEALGGEHIKYTELPGAGHGITGMVYPREDLHEWMFQQRREKKEADAAERQ